MTNKPLQVERRLDSRRETGVKVFAHDGVELKKCRLRDISLNGAFIETSDFPLTRGTEVELVLRIRREGRLTHCRLPAKVLRVEPEGAALVFSDLDEEHAKVVFDIVHVEISEEQSDASY